MAYLELYFAGWNASECLTTKHTRQKPYRNLKVMCTIGVSNFCTRSLEFGNYTCVGAPFSHG